MGTDIAPDIYYQAIKQYQAAELLFGAIRLDIFTHLDEPKTAIEIAAEIESNVQNAELLLLALSSCGYIDKQNDSYCNTKAGAAYLSKQSKYYIGHTILFRKEMTSLTNIDDSVMNGSELQTSLAYDFSTLAEVSAPEMYATGRVDSFIAEIKTIFTDTSQQYKMLDLGGGNGVLAIEFAKTFPGSKAVVFEIPSVAEVTKKIISEQKMEHYVSVLDGDFNKDNIGGAYNMIVASGILNFAASDLNYFMGKVAASLKDGGFLFLIGRYSNAEGYPQENILSWLSGYMNGVKPPPTKKRIEIALTNAKLQPVRVIQSGQFQGFIYRKAV